MKNQPGDEIASSAILIDMLMQLRRENQHLTEELSNVQLLLAHLKGESSAAGSPEVVSEVITKDLPNGTGGISIARISS